MKGAASVRICRKKRKQRVVIRPTQSARRGWEKRKLPAGVWRNRKKNKSTMAFSYANFLGTLGRGGKERKKRDRYSHRSLSEATGGGNFVLPAVMKKAGTGSEYREGHTLQKGCIGEKGGEIKFA